ncbi:hypothetical protein C7I84_21885 [Mesorhizobium ephedrae]|uniref:DUF2865 domain-containing protein n=1 Tax=Kumtagia ephedrae TaxID=2116701 RepID=A0A2P7S0J7_9HYPH|nr:hypothetical protein C7I84_21885 [Mesorhizobium ephedrae]
MVRRVFEARSVRSDEPALHNRDHRLALSRSLMRLQRSLIGIGAVAALLSLGMTSAYANACADLLARAARGGASAQSVALSKQLSAIQALERKRQCSSRGTGGLFNPCADLANRKADVQRQLARSQGGNQAALRARIAALGCGKPQQRKERREVVEASVKRAAPARSGPSIDTGVMLFCVRVEDGYFFPVPGSQFIDSRDYKQAVDQCSYICRGSQTSVYRLDDPELETEEMISVDTGRPYRELPTAFAYRNRTGFEACDFQGYHRRVNEARARTVTPFNMKNAVIPLPRERPDEPVPLMALTGDNQAPVVDLPADRKVRVVGPNFFPN